MLYMIPAIPSPDSPPPPNLNHAPRRFRPTPRLRRLPLSDGAIRVDKRAALAKDAYVPAVTITDTGNRSGTLELSLLCTAVHHRLPNRADPIVVPPAPVDDPVHAQQKSSHGFSQMAGAQARPPASHSTGARRSP